MKGIFITAGIVLALAGYFLIGSENVSQMLEKYSVEKMKGTDLEDAAAFNIRYMDFTGKYDRCLELISKFNERYEEKSKYLPEFMLTQARILELRLKTAAARDIYQKYVDTYPDAANVNDIKYKIMELK